MKRKIIVLCLAIAACCACKKDGLDADRPLRVEFGPDVTYAQDTLLYINLSDETSLNVTDLRDYMQAVKPSKALLLASEENAASVRSLSAGWGWSYAYAGVALDGKQAIILSKEKAVLSLSLSGAAAASFPS